MTKVDKTLIMIEKYENKVMEVINEMLLDFDAKNKKEFIEKKSLFLTGKITIDSKKIYIFHGRGCRVLDENKNEIVDWDFGYNDYWLGLDPLFLSKFIEANYSSNEKYSYFDISQAFDVMVKQGKMYIKAGLYYLT